jgi:hypothetical protein
MAVYLGCKLFFRAAQATFKECFVQHAMILGGDGNDESAGYN